MGIFNKIWVATMSAVVLIGIGLYLDLATKSWASFHVGQTISLIGDVLELKLAKNHGIAFSFPLHGLPLKIITIGLILGIFFLLKKEIQEKKYIGIISLSLLLGGALGNGYERIVYENVTDFIALKYFAIFNVADILIFVGIIIYLLGTWNLKSEK